MPVRTGSSSCPCRRFPVNWQEWTFDWQGWLEETIAFEEQAVVEMEETAVEEETELNDLAGFDPEMAKYAKAILEEIRKLPGGRIPSFMADKSFPRRVSHTLTRDPVLPKRPRRLIAESIIMGIQLNETQRKRYGDFLKCSTRIEEGLCGHSTPAASETSE